MTERRRLGEPIEPCARCSGEGIVAGPKVCGRCRGEGVVPAAWWDPSSPNRDRHESGDGGST